MWKPGSSKPSSSSSFAALAAPTTKATTSRPDPGRRSDEGTEQEEAESDPPQQHSRASKSASEPLRTKALSGATLNMRFMKRKGGGGAASSREEAAAAASSSLSNSRKNSSSPPQRPAEAATAPSTAKTPTSAVTSLRFLDMGSPARSPPTSSSPPGNSNNVDDSGDVEMTDAGDDERRRQDISDHGDCDDPYHDNKKSPQHRPASLGAATATGFEAATSLDMYGGRGNVLGRRSFGKFNIVVEANWSASLRHACGVDGEGNVEDGSRRTKAKQRGGRQHERPIGNLDSKVPRSSSNNSSRGRGRSQGKKRKTMISDVS